MTDYISSSSLIALLPYTKFDVPYVGTVDFLPYILAALVFLALNVLFWLLRKVLIVRLTLLAQKTNSTADDAFVSAAKSIHSIVYTIVSIYFAAQFLSLPNSLATGLQAIFYIAIAWQVIRILTRLIKHFTEQHLKVEGEDDFDANAATAADMLTLLAKIVLWVLGGLFVLSNLGIEVTSLIAGLGIGGIAIAFALQGILSDLFASFSLYFDKPFRIGDFIVIGNDSGNVEKIGIKTTRIRTLQGEELVVSNAELTTVRVQNFKKMHERRIVTQFGVTYETPAPLLKIIPKLVADIFNEVKTARLDRVHFTTFGDSALMFEVVYFVASPEYGVFLDVQQSFNFALLEAFQKNEIEFAYPTQVIYTKTS